MATVVVQAVASLDGFIARPDDMPGPIFDWYEAGDVELTFNPDHVFHVSQQSVDYLDTSGVALPADRAAPLRLHRRLERQADRG